MGNKQVNNSNVNENTYLLGFDLCNDYSQISYWNTFKNQPETINPTGGFGSYLIPMSLLYQEDTDEWIIGEDALLMRQDTNGVWIDNIIADIGIREYYEVGNSRYNSSEILAIFLDKSLSILEKINPNSYIEAVTVTITNKTPLIEKTINEAFDIINLPLDRVSVQTHIESCISYILHQDVTGKKFGLFDLSEDGLHYYQLYINNITKPAQLVIQHIDIGDKLKGQHINDKINELIREIYKDKMGKENISDEEEIELNKLYYQNRQYLFSKISQKSTANIFFNFAYPPFKAEIKPIDIIKSLSEYDYKFDYIIREMFRAEIVSTIYLSGSGFNIPWANRSLETLCSSRRVFQGSNLFSQGACYSIAEKYGIINQQEVIKTGAGFLSVSIGINGYIDGKETFVPIVRAGEYWNRANNSIKIILDNINKIPIYIKKQTEIPKVITSIELTDMNTRPNKTIRLSISVNCRSDREFEIIIQDIGFGMLYPATDKTWSKTITV